MTRYTISLYVCIREPSHRSCFIITGHVGVTSSEGGGLSPHCPADMAAGLFYVDSNRLE
jgi:hypothetical protein